MNTLPEITPPFEGAKARWVDLGSGGKQYTKPTDEQWAAQKATTSPCSRADVRALSGIPVDWLAQVIAERETR